MDVHRWGVGLGYSGWCFTPTNRGTDTFTFPPNERLRVLVDNALGAAPGGEDRFLAVESRYGAAIILRLRAPVKGANVVNLLAPMLEAETRLNA